MSVAASPEAPAAMSAAMGSNADRYGAQVVDRSDVEPRNGAVRGEWLIADGKYITFDVILGRQVEIPLDEALQIAQARIRIFRQCASLIDEENRELRQRIAQLQAGK